MQLTHRTLVEWVLNTMSKAYGFGHGLIQAYYRRRPARVGRVNARVISVGNITWGGTGKTPLVMMLARALSAKGKRVAVLTRGYGQDEVHELRSSLTGVPVYVGANRFRNAQKAIAERQADVILLDDGFQHFRIHRNCDVVTVNATNAFGNGYLIPRGNLREPLSNLSRADVFVLTNASLGRNQINLIRQRLKQIQPRAPVFESDHEPVRFVDCLSNREVRLDAVRNKKTAVLSGIEDPLSFERTVERLGAQIVYAARFNDHHVFTPLEIRQVFRAYRELRADCLVTTFKDYYRLGRALGKVDSNGIRIYALQIEIRIDDEEGFLRKCAGVVM